MRILVIIGADTKITVDKQAIADATLEKFWVNTMPPNQEEGWVFMDCGKEPDWNWPDYVIVIGTCETGRHEVTEHIQSTEDIKSHLVDTYDRLSEETGDEV